MNIGLALGGGAARGWAHIGIITTLADMGITPSMRFYTDNSKVKNEEDSLYLFAHHYALTRICKESRVTEQF